MLVFRTIAMLKSALDFKDTFLPLTLMEGGGELENSLQFFEGVRELPPIFRGYRKTGGAPPFFAYLIRHPFRTFPENCVPDYLR